MNATNDQFSNQRKHFIAVFTSIVIIVLFCYPIRGMESLADRILIMQCISPNTFSYISPQNGIERHFKTKTMDETALNYCVLRTPGTIYKDNELQVLIDDLGTIHVTGKNTSGLKWIRLSPSSVQLPEDVYSVNVNCNNSEGCNFIIEGWRIQETDGDAMTKQILASGNSYAEFSATDSYENYWYGLEIAEGFDSTDTCYTPVFSRNGLESAYYSFEGNYSSPDYSNVLLFRMDNSQYSQCEQIGLRAFANNIEYIYRRKYDWCTIIGEKWNGVQIDFVNDKVYIGPIDSIGRVREVIKKYDSVNSFRLAFANKELQW